MLISDLIKGGITIGTLETLVTAFYSDGWMPDVGQLHTAARVGNITLFEWLRKQNPTLDIDGYLFDAARRSEKPGMLEHVPNLISLSQSTRVKMRVTS